MRRFALILSLVASFPLVAADAKVKTLLVATDRSLDALLPLIKQYEKTAKIKVVMETHGKELFTWLQEHPRKADLVVSADVLTLEKAKRSGLLYPLHSQLIDSNVITTYREKRNLYVGLSTHTRAIFYSKKRVKPEQLSTYNDLADIKWRGRICLGSGYGEENLILFTQIAADDGFGRIKDFLQGLKANLARTPGGDDREQIHAIAAGKCDLTLADSRLYGRMREKPDERSWVDDTEIFFPNQNVGGAYMMISGAALTSVTQTESENEAQCRAEATKLIEFLTTPRVQEELIRKFSEYPLNPSAQISGLFASAGKGQKEVRQGTFEKRFIGASTILDLREDVLSVLDEVNFDSKHPPPAPKKAEIERDAEEAKRGDEFIHVHRDQPTETP